MASTIKAVALDALTVFDPRSVVAVADVVFPGRGAEIGAAWRTRQFEYTWLLTAAGRYTDFWTVTSDALVFAARTLKLDLTEKRRERLLSAFLEIEAYPDAAAALATLRQAGLRLAFLTNMTVPMVQASRRTASAGTCTTSAAF
jgi:2-haloacid dehalogenase